MTAIETATALYSCVVLIMIWLVGYLWRNYRMESFRQDLFDIRWELYQYARAGRVQFDDDAYKNMRRHINALFKYAYHVNFSTLISVQVARRWYKQRELTGVQELIAADPKLDHVQRRVLLDLYDRMLWACVRQIAFTSVLAWPCGAAVIAYITLRQMLRKMREQESLTVTGLQELPPTMKRHVQTIEWQAVDEWQAQSDRQKLGGLAGA